jgi:DNA polymerase III subunit delta'
MAEDDSIEADEETRAALAVPTPRENTRLLGHEAAEAALLQAYNSGRLSHAWLFTGPRGIGKASLAYRFARFLLAEAGNAGGLLAAPLSALTVAPTHPAFRLVVSGAHPDLLVVERGVDPRRKRQRREILAGEARGVAEFLHLTSGQGGWRIVIVDGADAMNIQAANSLLKILEEPPRRAILLLVSDNPGRLLPTIRSRCRSLPLKALSGALVAQLLETYRPDLAAVDRALLTALGEGSIGRALDLADSGVVGIYDNLSNMLSVLPHIDMEALHGFADRFARPGAEDNFALLAELLSGWLARLVGLAAGGQGAVSVDEERAMRRLAAGRGLDRWVEVWEKLTHLFAQAEGINLDRKQVVLSAFFALEEAAR